MVLYLTYWIPAAERARTGAFHDGRAGRGADRSPVSEALLALDGRLGPPDGNGYFIEAARGRQGVAALWYLTTDRSRPTGSRPASARGWARSWRECAERSARHGDPNCALLSGRVLLLVHLIF
jgi:hypothetical protein